MYFNKRSLILVFVALFVALAGARTVLVAAYASATVGLTIVIGLMAYSLVGAMRNWRLDHPHVLRHR